MTFQRRNAGVVAHGDLLFVIGGDDGSTNLNNVEVSVYFKVFFIKDVVFSSKSIVSMFQVYCPKSNTWRVLPATMGIGRSYAGVCMIDKPM